METFKAEEHGPRKLARSTIDGDSFQHEFHFKRPSRKFWLRAKCSTNFHHAYTTNKAAWLASKQSWSSSWWNGGCQVVTWQCSIARKRCSSSRKQCSSIRKRCLTARKQCSSSRKRCSSARKRCSFKSSERCRKRGCTWIGRSQKYWWWWLMRLIAWSWQIEARSHPDKDSSHAFLPEHQWQNLSLCNQGNLLYNLNHTICTLISFSIPL